MRTFLNLLLIVPVAMGVAAIFNAYLTLIFIIVLVRVACR